MIDFHTHILFDVDHGVQTKKLYTRMIRRYAKHGIDTVVLTPHLYHPHAECRSKNIKQNFEEAKQIAQQYGVTVLLGCELYFDATKTDMEVLPIEGQYLLVEFPVDYKPLRLEEKLQKLQNRGYQIIVAHIERYNWLKPKSPLMTDLRNMGCLFQVNMDNMKSRKVKQYLKAHLVDIVASDNHGDLRAPRKLKKIMMKHPQLMMRMDEFSLEKETDE